MTGEAVGVILAVLVVVANAGTEGAVGDAIYMTGETGRPSRTGETGKVAGLAKLF